MQLDGQFAQCPAAVECPEFYIMNPSIGLLQNLFDLRVISLFVVHSTSYTCMKQFCTIIALIIFICAKCEQFLIWAIWCKCTYDQSKFLVTYISNEKPMCSFAPNVFNMHINLFHMHNICVAHNAYQPCMLKTLHATMLVTNVSYIMVRTSSFFY